MTITTPIKRHRNDSQIRLMHIVNCLALSGTEYNVIKLLNNLDRKQFSPSVIDLQPTLSDARAHVAKDIDVFELPKGEGFQPRLIVKMAKLFRQLKIDIIHSHNWTTFLYSVLAARLASVPLIIHGEHGRDTADYERNPKQLRMRKFLASICDHLTAVSPDIVEILENMWHVPKWKISLHPNGVALDKFKPSKDRSVAKKTLGIDKRALTIGTVIGTIRPVKDIPTLLKAFALACQNVSNLQLLIVGDGPSKNEMQNLSRELNISGSVHFLGKSSDIPRMMQAFDIYVSSSVYEGMSNTILEAMACGIPVVATAVGGTPFIVKDGHNGVLIPPQKSQIMSAAILGLIADKKKRTEIAKRGRIYVEQNHSFDKTIRNYETLYLHLYNERKKRTDASTLRSFTKSVYANVSYSSGLNRISNKINRNKINVVNYHRVLNANELPHYLYTPMAMSTTVFERHIEFFNRRCNVLTVDECLDILKNNMPVPPNAIALTFDDGYGELYDRVMPILEKYNVPCTVFLPTRLIDENKPTWYDTVGLQLCNSNLEALQPFERFPEHVVSILKELNTLHRQQRNCLTRIVVQQIAKLPYSSRHTVITELNKLECDANGIPGISLVTWDMVREMKETGLFTFGSHTLTHPRLDFLPEVELEKELIQSKTRLEEILNVNVNMLSYPWGSYSKHVIERVQEAGYQCAFRLTHQTNYTGQNLFEINRIDAGYLTLNNAFHEGIMSTELAGMNQFLRSMRQKILPSTEQFTH